MVKLVHPIQAGASHALSSSNEDLGLKRGVNNHFKSIWGLWVSRSFFSVCFIILSPHLI